MKVNISIYIQITPPRDLQIHAQTSNGGNSEIAEIFLVYLLGMHLKSKGIAQSIFHKKVMTKKKSSREVTSFRCNSDNFDNGATEMHKAIVYIKI
jgi:hypothetical protein